MVDLNFYVFILNIFINEVLHAPDIARIKEKQMDTAT